MNQKVKRQYDKRPMSITALGKRLIDRGLVADRKKLRHALKTVGYFRLTGYLYPFRKKKSESYRKGMTFDKLWEIYTFDRKLRLMAADALARIEVAVRTLIVSKHTAAFPRDPFAYIQPAALPGLKPRKHTELLNSIASVMLRARGEPDLKHLKDEYGIEDYPPVWNVMEHSPFGVVTLYYEGLDAKVKEGVSNAFYIEPNAFQGVLMVLKIARNVCAHHARLWNKHIRARVATSLGVRKELAPLHECLRTQPDMNVYTSPFLLLSICAHCIRYVHPQSDWTNRCKALLKTANATIRKGMGVPAGWQTLSLWK